MFAAITVNPAETSFVRVEVGEDLGARVGRRDRRGADRLAMPARQIERA
jgi:hypothetical protein